MVEPPLGLDVLVEEFESVVLPLRDGKVKEVVSILPGLADGRINFQQMRLVQTFQFIGQCVTWCRAIIVGGLNQHDRRLCLVYGSQESFAQFGRTLS